MEALADCSLFLIQLFMVNIGKFYFQQVAYINYQQMKMTLSTDFFSLNRAFNKTKIKAWRSENGLIFQQLYFIAVRTTLLTCE